MAAVQKAKIHIQGAVQGVGFRPFIYRTARQHGLTGWVANAPDGVYVEVEGLTEKIQQFLCAIDTGKPEPAKIYSLKYHLLDPSGFTDFEIIKSLASGIKSTWILPDIATCPECLAEIFDPQNRRYLYPFTNCTHCGPRFTIIECLPYDRPNTTMKSFEMCPDCLQEYKDPENRRFHAQPNACPACGPHLDLINHNGQVVSSHQKALENTAALLKEGKIVAVKGLGGFHLMAHAGNSEAIRRLRTRKHRDEKPFALMMVSDDAEKYCHISSLEQRALHSPEAPIVLLYKKESNSNAPPNRDLAENIAPGNPFLGVMLPYTPLHHILLHLTQHPVVATSGNLSDDTICIDNDDALNRLGNIADFFLVHNRRIFRHADDSIVRIMDNRESVLRRARGYVPFPVMLRNNGAMALAVGGHLKNTVTIGKNGMAFPSQHIGDLDTPHTIATFDKTIKDMSQLYTIKPRFTIHDSHPDYTSAKRCNGLPGKKIAVQHHFAHILSCMAENMLAPPVLGIAWDGTGYGLDRTIWGGEFLNVNEKDFHRIAHLRTFSLLGGEACIKKPYRTAIALLYAVYQEDIDEVFHLSPFQRVRKNEISPLLSMLKKNVNCPLTSSAGRLFDAASSLLNVQHINHYEAQAAMQLEYTAWRSRDVSAVYPFELNFDKQHNTWIIDWEPMIREMIKELEIKKKKSLIAAGFHNTLTEMMVSVAQKVGKERVVLSGGTFQNRYLTERACQRLKQEGFQVYTHQLIPPNDGGISVGQLYALSYHHKQ